MPHVARRFRICAQAPNHFGIETLTLRAPTEAIARDRFETWRPEWRILSCTDEGATAEVVPS